MRKRIDATEPDLAKLTRSVWQSIERDNRGAPKLFRYAGDIVRIAPGEDGSCRIEVVTPDRFTWYLAESFEWQNGSQVTKPTVRLVRNLLATPDPPLPILERLISAPCFAADGTLHDEPGYSPESRCFLSSPTQHFEVSETPDASEVETAREVLYDVTADFPFKSQADRANWIALAVLPFARDLIPGPTPFHLISKPVEGTGGSLLADVAMRPFLGAPPESMAFAHTEQERAYSLTSRFATAPAVVLFDNVDAKLDSSSLCSAVTTRVYSNRPVGSGTVRRFPVRCVWLATGNNPALSREMARRTVLIRLDPQCERPWDRASFRHPHLIEYVDENREVLVWAALTLIQAWIAAGRSACPDSTPRLGSFEAWRRVLGGILQAAGIDGFLSNLSAFREAPDDELGPVKAFLGLWHARHGSDDVTVGDVIDLAPECDPAARPRR